MNRNTALAALALLTTAGPTGHTQGLRSFVRDPSHSQITFVANARLIDAQGFWDSWDADIKFDPDAIEKSSISITIEAKSVNTHVDMRDKDLRGERFFNVDAFPTITFVSKTINRSGAPSPDSMMAGTRLLITGDLSIKGVTKLVTAPATIAFYDRRANRGRVKGQLTLLREDYGVGYNPPGNPIENEVLVAFDVTFRLPQPARGG